ncbi:MAG: hypothetical protein KAH44_11300 [Oricola sp.]|jgi:phosphoheptose isomerase|nr:hypothetical protein [Oricola sp.]
MAKLSAREKITKSEYLQIVGLLTIAADLNKQSRAVETALLKIVQETDRDGKLLGVWDGGFVCDAVGGGLEATDLLDRLGLSVEEDSADD